MKQLQRKQIQINGIRRDVISVVGPKVLVKIGQQRVWLENPRVLKNMPKIGNHGILVEHSA